MADDKNISTIGVTSVLHHGQRLRRCLSDRSITGLSNVEHIKVLKIPRRQNKDKENYIPVGLQTIVPKMPLLSQQKEERPLEQNMSEENDSDEDKLMINEFNFDKNNNDSVQDTTNHRIHSHNTPPPSPTWNLKMLCEAVSPEIRRMQQEKELNTEEGRSSSTSSSTYPIVSPSEENSRDYVDPSFVMSQEASTAVDMDVFTSRKDKSLGKLCDKFLSKYPEFPDGTKYEICLDEVAKDLAVERRRIYDIVNVLESVEIVSRVAKNRYTWHGKTNLPHTLVKLKMLAKQDKIAEQMQRLQEQEMEGVVSSACGGESSGLKDDITNEESTQTVLQRKDRSLGIMSQKFLMLFLVSKPKTVNLELSARLLIDDPSVHYVWAPKFKTKIRRLYDIANILTSLRLIQKIHVTEFRGRKPAFMYIGPNVDGVEDIDSCCNDGCHRPSSRHSLLDCVRNDSYVQSMTNTGFKPIRPAGMDLDARKADIRAKLQRHMSEGSVQKMPRHSSCDEFFKVVEKERNLLFNSSSQPTSPIKKLNFEDDSGQKEHMFVVPSLSKHLSFDDHQRPGISKPNHPIPGKIIHRPKAVQAQAKPRNIVFCTPSPGANKPTETIIVTKDGEVKCMPEKSGKIVPIPGISNSIISKSQLDQVIQFKLSTTKSSAQREIQFNKPKDGFTAVGRSLLQSPDREMAILNETSPMPGTTFIRRTLKRNMVEVVESGSSSEKRVKMELPTPPCGSTISDSLIVMEDSSPSTPGSLGKITTLRRIKSSPLSTSLESGKPLPHFVIRQVRKPAFTNSNNAHQIRVQLTPKNQSQGIVTPTMSSALPVEGKICTAHVIADSHVSLTPGAPFQPVSGDDSGSTPVTPIPVRIIENQDYSSLLSNKKGISSFVCNPDPFSPPPTPKSTPQSGSVSSLPSDIGKMTVTTPSSSSSSFSSSRHSATSPFKVVLPSSRNNGTPTTFLVKVPRSKLSKMASM